MIYRAIGLMSGSSMDGLDIVFVEFQENAGKWTYEILAADCFAYSAEWKGRLENAISLPALEYQLLHADYGHYVGQEVNRFIDAYQLHYKVALIASHGHTTFHFPAKKMTAQLGDGAAIAATTHLPVVSDLRSMDIAFGGQGAPIVPIGEKLLLNEYDYFLNLGGIANISANTHGTNRDYIAFDVCPANRVLNLLVKDLGKDFDDKGELAAEGNIDSDLLKQLNHLNYYQQPAPKSLANDFGTDIVFPLIREKKTDVKDALRTYTEHIAVQIKNALTNIIQPVNVASSSPLKLLCTGGGAFNDFLIERIKYQLKPFNIEIIIPDDQLINYKEALIMALIGVLRWRQENNVMASVTGASRDSIGGALWTGQEA
jgi:anhydro-N-acetylmuramic acid kinase